MPIDKLLAKRPSDLSNPNAEETLVGHTKRVVQSAETLSSMLCHDIKGMVGCTKDDVRHWKKAVILGAWIHDWGKANDHFQKMIRDPSFRQGIRHEALSLIMCAELDFWLFSLWENLPEWAKAGAFFSAAGHHLKYPDPFEGQRNGTRVQLFTSHGDFKALLYLGVDHFELQTPPSLKDLEYDLLPRGNLKRKLKHLIRELDHDFNSVEKTLIATVKATVISADLAGSALPHKMDSIGLWIQKRLEQSLKGEDLNNVARKKLGEFEPFEFQREIIKIRSNTILLEAGCGSGKTIAAYLWASKHASGKRVFFAYPTTGTASEGFSGYLREPEFDRILVHSRADVDYRLLPNIPSRGHEENDLRQAGLEALETWPVPAVVCTTHTVLGILENVRRGLLAWPSLARAVFVFDEVHAFSNRLFSYFLRFLEALPGTNVLLMTATLPPSRRKAVEKACEARGGITVVKGPERRENAPRYLMQKADAEKVWPEVEKAMEHGLSVLWVCNTISRAMDAVGKAIDKGLAVEPFHSRYRYKDRLMRQRAVIDGFNKSNSPILAVTTQVAEMSLDLSADMMVTEWAPIPSMIQRMGRLNRFEEEPGNVCSALFIDPGNRLPYEQDDDLWAGVKEWIDKLCDGQPKSQRNLADVFIQITERYGTEIKPVQYCEWLDGVWRSRKDKRAIEEAGYTIEVVREEDLKNGSASENAIPMPIPQIDDYLNWDQAGRYLVTPRGSIIYDEFKGAKWNID